MATQQATAADGGDGELQPQLECRDHSFRRSAVATPSIPLPTPRRPSIPLEARSRPMLRARSANPATIIDRTLPNHGKFGTTGQAAPSGMKSRVTSSLWEEEGSLCFHVEARGVTVTRREDNNMINGSKLLNVAGMTRGRRDGILKSEKVRHVVKIGPMHLKGVWIPFDRALHFANKEKITGILYPLFADNIRALVDKDTQSEPLRAAPQYSQVLSDTELSTPPGSKPRVMSECAPAAGMAMPDILHTRRRGRIVRDRPPPSPPREPISHITTVPTALLVDTATNILHPAPSKKRQREPEDVFSPVSTRKKKELSPVLPQNENEVSPVLPQKKREVSPVTSPDPDPASDTGTHSTVSNQTASDYTASLGDGETLPTLANKKRALLTRLMRFFFLIISTPPSPPRNAGNYGSGQSQTTSSGSGSRSAPQESGGSSSTSSSSKEASQKRQRVGDGDNGHEDEDRDNKRSRPSGFDISVESDLQRLACPFFKHNQSRYRMWRACPGPGWPTVHRIKEHVYRKHALPVRCPRCHQVFDTELQKDDHISQEERCAQTEDTSPPEGIDADKAKLLRSRKGKNKEASEVEKWNEMYMILFPEADSANLPSPYYDYAAELPPPGSPGGEFIRYEQFLRRELPGRVRQELETRIEERINPMEETLRGELVEIVRDMQLQLFELYKASRNPETEQPEAAPTEHVQGHQAEVVIQSIPIATASDDMGPLEAFVQPPLVNPDNWIAFDDFDGQIWDPSMLDSRTLWAGDSGYDSLPADLAQNEHFEGSCEKCWGFEQ